MKTVVLQSNYIPWKGYFDLIHDADLFIFYDEVQYTKNDWRNRNKIYTNSGVRWITLPCGYNLNNKISETKLKNNLKWQEKHYNLLKENYSKAPYWSKYRGFLEYLYFEKTWTYLSELNHYIIKNIAMEILKLKTRFMDSTEYKTSGTGHEKLLNLLIATGTTHYISGPTAKKYIVEDDYKKNNISIEWKDYSGYPKYKQLHEPFEHKVSIIDLLLNTGENAGYYIWGWRENNCTISG